VGVCGNDRQDLHVGAGGVGVLSIHMRTIPLKQRIVIDILEQQAT
jgi:hypothetical protein